MALKYWIFLAAALVVGFYPLPPVPLSSAPWWHDPGAWVQIAFLGLLGIQIAIWIWAGVQYLKSR